MQHRPLQQKRKDAGSFHFSCAFTLKMFICLKRSTNNHFTRQERESFPVRRRFNQGNLIRFNKIKRKTILGRTPRARGRERKGEFGVLSDQSQEDIEIVTSMLLWVKMALDTQLFSHSIKETCLAFPPSEKQRVNHSAYCRTHKCLPQIRPLSLIHNVIPP